ncbi:MAG: preprotein translocase subunit Sec61beta [Candidatus Nanoarchaeia archaeon]
MAEKSSSVSMPGAFGGLMRYSEEYTSKINLKPTYIVAFIILIIIFRIFLGIFYGPIS